VGEAGSCHSSIALVITGFIPVIHGGFSASGGVDCRDGPGNDGGVIRRQDQPIAWGRKAPYPIQAWKLPPAIIAQ